MKIRVLVGPSHFELEVTGIDWAIWVILEKWLGFSIQVNLMGMKWIGSDNMISKLNT